MVVICVRPTKKLVKGGRYQVDGLWNSGNNKRYLEGRVFILNFGYYSVNNFSDINGKPLPKIDIALPTREVTFLNFKDVKEGDVLVCKSDSYKTLAKNVKYQVESCKIIHGDRVNWAGSKIPYVIEKVKFVGIPRYYIFSSWRFRKLNLSESRELSLSNILDDKNDVVKLKHKRKFDLIPDKEKELIRVLSKSIIDPNRHYLNVIDWACQKCSNTGINPDD